ncbi:hypothetical protein ACLB2K_069765 [Fragaria x ananassa]
MATANLGRGNLGWLTEFFFVVRRRLSKVLGQYEGLLGQGRLGASGDRLSAPPPPSPSSSLPPPGTRTACDLPESWSTLASGHASLSAKPGLGRDLGSGSPAGGSGLGGSSEAHAMDKSAYFSALRFCHENGVAHRKTSSSTATATSDSDFVHNARGSVPG